MTSQTIRTLLGFLQPQGWALPALVLLGALASLAEGVGIGLLIPLLQMLEPDAQPAKAGPLVEAVQWYAEALGTETRFALLGTTIVGLIALKSALLFSYISFAARIHAGVFHALRSALIHQLLSVGYIFFARHDQGRVLNTVTQSAWFTNQALWVLFRFLSALCTVAVFAVLLLLMSWQLTLATAAGAALGSLVMWWLGQLVRRWGELRLQAFDSLYERVLEVLNGIRVIRMFNQEAAEQARFDDHSDRVRRSHLRMTIASEAVVPILEMVYAPLFIAAVAVAWHLEVGVPTLVAFLALVYRLLPYVKNLEHARVELAGYAASVADVAALLDRADKPYTPSGILPFQGLRDAIAFDNVTFRYGDSDADHPALRTASFRIKKGETVAVVGASGSGKSTIVNLLCRLYEPTAGEIMVDGKPLRELDLAAWRSRVVMAGQDAELMSGTVLENISYGRPDAGRAAIVAAARQADAHDFIEALPEGYDTRVGVRGLTLSGGQRQRIGLARALLRQPDILILDEATNAVDGVSELAILETLERIAGQLTVIIVAHRLSTIRSADRVIVLKEGCVVEQGRLDDLLGDRGGALARLHGAAFRERSGAAMEVG